jgi:dTDP-4-dehydrorhamnose reductase
VGQARKILVTGASGFLGWNVCRRLQREYEVVGVSRRTPLRIEGVVGERCDLTDYREVRALFHRQRPDAVIHAAAVASPNTCQQHPSESRAVNVDASVSIAGLCNDVGIPCVFTSSDLVFDGVSPPYDEGRPASPISVYGEQKVKAERAMLERHDRVTVCRMPLMYGDALPPAQSFLQPLIRGILAGEEIALFTDEFRTPVSGVAAAEGILLALTCGEKLLHLGGRESVSRYEIGNRLAQALGCSNAKLRPVLQGDVPAIAPRPGNVSLDSGKAFALGYDPLPIEAALKQLACVRTATGG